MYRTDADADLSDLVVIYGVMVRKGVGGKWIVLDGGRCALYMRHTSHCLFVLAHVLKKKKKKFICGIDIYKYYINQVLTIPESESIINI